jgi:hypothetical protein
MSEGPRSLAEETPLDIRTRVEAAIVTGTGLERVLENATTQELLRLALLVETGVMGKECASLRPTLMKELRSRPEQAQMLGDRIDELANEPGTASRRMNNFEVLTFIGSAEALRQMGRFLWDERQPDPMVPGHEVATEPVKMAAAWALLKTLGPRAPVDANSVDFYNKGGLHQAQMWFEKNKHSLSTWEKPIARGLHAAPKPPEQQTSKGHGEAGQPIPEPAAGVRGRQK